MQNNKKIIFAFDVLKKNYIMKKKAFLFKNFINKRFLQTSLT